MVRGLSRYVTPLPSDRVVLGQVAGLMVIGLLGAGVTVIVAVKAAACSPSARAEVAAVVPAMPRGLVLVRVGADKGEMLFLF